MKSFTTFSALILLSNFHFHAHSQEVFNIKAGEYQGIDQNEEPCSLEISEKYYYSNYNEDVVNVKSSYASGTYIMPAQWVDLDTSTKDDEQVDEIIEQLKEKTTARYGALGLFTTSFIPFGSAINVGVKKDGTPVYFTHARRAAIRDNFKRICIL